MTIVIHAWFCASTLRLATLFGDGLPVRLELEKAAPLARFDEQRLPALAAGEVERATFFAVETGDLPWRQHETNARAGGRRRPVGIGRLGNHEHHVAGAGLLDKISAHRLRAEVVADALDRAEDGLVFVPPASA